MAAAPGSSLAARLLRLPPQQPRARVTQKARPPQRARLPLEQAQLTHQSQLPLGQAQLTHQSQLPLEQARLTHQSQLPQQQIAQPPQEQALLPQQVQLHPCQRPFRSRRRESSFRAARRSQGRKTLPLAPDSLPRAIQIGPQAQSHC
jgi:hypothetical protein